MTPIGRLAAWIANSRQEPKCAWCGSRKPTSSSVSVRGEWFCSTEHADEQQLFWSAI